MTFVTLFLALAGLKGPPNPYRSPPQATPVATATGNDLVIAAALLHAPWGTPEPAPPPDRFPGLCDAVYRVAVEWQVMDKRETYFLLSSPDKFGEDLNTLRRRMKDLQGAPPLSDTVRFPDRAEVAEAIRFNRSYRGSVERRMELDTQRLPLFLQVVRETDELYTVWDAARDAQCDFYYVQVRRLALARLRTLIGDEAYRAGELPPAAPIWRFNELR